MSSASREERKKKKGIARRPRSRLTLETEYKPRVDENIQRIAVFRETSYVAIHDKGYDGGRNKVSNARRVRRASWFELRSYEKGKKRKKSSRTAEGSGESRSIFYSPRVRTQPTAAATAAPTRSLLGNSGEPMYKGIRASFERLSLEREREGESEERQSLRSRADSQRRGLNRSEKRRENVQREPTREQAPSRRMPESIRRYEQPVEQLTAKLP